MQCSNARCVADGWEWFSRFMWRWWWWWWWWRMGFALAICAALTHCLSKSRTLLLFFRRRKEDEEEVSLLEARLLMSPRPPASCFDVDKPTRSQVPACLQRITLQIYRISPHFPPADGWESQMSQTRRSQTMHPWWWWWRLEVPRILNVFLPPSLDRRLVYQKPVS